MCIKKIFRQTDQSQNDSLQTQNLILHKKLEIFEYENKV